MTRPTPRSETRAVLRAEVKDGRGELHLYGPIGGWFGLESKEVAEKISEIANKGAKSLDVYINSPGGVAFDGIAIYNAIKRFAGSKVVHVDGLAASAASIIAMAGDEIHVPAGAQIMVHPPHGVAVGGAVDMRKTAEVLDGLRESMLSVYAEKTKAKRSDLESWVDAETWMDGATALERGFATHVEPDDEDEPGEKREEPDEPEDSVLRQLVATWRNAPPSIAEKYLNPKLAVALASAKSATGLPAAEEEETTVADTKKTAPETTEATGSRDAARAEFAERHLEDVKALTAKASIAEAMGVLVAWKDAHESAQKLAKENAELKAQYAEGESARLIDAATREGRLTPAQREQALALGKKDLDTLKAFIAATTPLPAATVAREREAKTARTPTPPGAPGASAAEPTAATPFGGALSKKQKLALHGVNEAEFLAHWNKRKAEQAALNAEVDE